MLIDTKATLMGAIFAVMAASAVHAERFDIPSGDLASAVDAFTAQSGITLVVSSAEIKGLKTGGVKGDLSPVDALAKMLRGTGFVSSKDAAGVLEIVRQKADRESFIPQRVAAAPAPTVSGAALETVTVTSSKIGGDVQNIPISITALSQEQLTSRQIAGGPDLVKEVPNLTFSKTNFTGYNIEIRGIGTQAISVSTDPAVAVALNDIPFIRNHFFEQEFFDVNQVEVLRGPQGTLYGRNATAGVVNVITAKPTDQFEAMVSADIGNYQNRRLEGMLNIPIVDDRVDLRVAGEWTKRDGYSFDEITDKPIDGRDLWSGRMTLGFKPTEKLQTTLVWEHFSEDDDRMRTAKQLCKTAPNPTIVGGITPNNNAGSTFAAGDYLSQGCLPTSLYSADAFDVPNGYSLPYYSGITGAVPVVRVGFDVYANTTQSPNLRVIDSSINPVYKAKNDTLELNADYAITPALTITSQTGYNRDFLWSTEDYNRFNSAPGAFSVSPGDNVSTNYLDSVTPDPSGLHVCASTNNSCLAVGAPCTPSASNDACQAAGMFCDPQLGCSDRLVAEDLSEEHAWQLSQEFRLASKFSGPLNFSVGGNYLHYETEENYYVFINTLTLLSLYDAEGPYVPGVTDNSSCLPGGFRNPNPAEPGVITSYCMYIDPNPISSVNGEGHNYFLSQNPYDLNSYAGFGEAYYAIAPDLKLTGGLRWTEDRKRFIEIPSELVLPGYGYAVSGVVNQQWDQLTGRTAINWTPKLDFTDQTLVYGSYAHGYKAGGANPPGAIFPVLAQTGEFQQTNPIHPLTFKPEFIDAYELGTKNTLLDGALTLNGDVFYYNYKNYQISRIVDRTAINDNFNATVRGAELETSWEPSPGLKFSFAGGYEDATLNKGDQSVDLMDRTAGNPNWIVLRPTVTEASNCILPTYVVAAMLDGDSGQIINACNDAYNGGVDPRTGAPYVQKPTGVTYAPNGVTTQYPGFDPLAGTPGDPYTGQNYDPYRGIDIGPVPNNGQGFDKNLGGNQLPNAPHFTTSLTAEYTLPVSEDWVATLHSDFYWQSQSWARVFNDRPYDELRGYSNVNMALILTNARGWQVIGYLKNVFNSTAITGDFLNSDDSGLTTNVFLTDPRLYGVRITKNF